MSNPSMSRLPSLPRCSRDSVYGVLTLAAFAACLMFPRFLAYAPGILGLLGCGFYWADCKPALRKLKPALLFVIVFIAFAGLTSLWAVHQQAATDRLIKASAVLLPGLLLLVVAHAKPCSLSVRNKLYAFTGLWLICNVIFATDFYFDFPVFRLIRDLPADAKVSMTVFNWHMIVTLLWGTFLMHALWETKNTNPVRHYALIGIMIALLTLCMIKTSSQAAQLSFVLILPFIFFTPYRSAYFWHAFTAALVIVTLGAPMIFPWLHGVLDVKNTWEPLRHFLIDASAQHRLDIWNVVSDYIAEKPLQGHGLEATKHLRFDPSISNFFIRNPVILHPHNFGLQLWLELGILGAIGGSVLLYRMTAFLRQLMRSRSDCLIFAGFIVWLVTAFTSYGIWQSWFIGLSLVMLAAWVQLKQSRMLAER